MALTILACYDISADGARARVAAYLQQRGSRIQRSVFVCAIAPDELDTVRDRLADMIDPNTDAVHLLPRAAPAGPNWWYSAKPTKNQTNRTGRCCDYSIWGGRR